MNYDTSVDTEILDQWVIKGGLIDIFIDDNDEMPCVDVTVEKYVVNKMG